MGVIGLLEVGVIEKKNLLQKSLYIAADEWVSSGHNYHYNKKKRGVLARPLYIARLGVGWLSRSSRTLK